MTTWGKRTTKDLIEYMAATMPPGKPSLAEADYVNISAFILQYNGATAGTQALAATTADADRDRSRRDSARRRHRAPRRAAVVPVARRVLPVRRRHAVTRSSATSRTTCRSPTRC